MEEKQLNDLSIFDIFIGYRMFLFFDLLLSLLLNEEKVDSSDNLAFDKNPIVFYINLIKYYFF